MIKQLTGLDKIDTDVKFQRRKSFYNRAKLLLFTNNPIVTRSLHSEAFFNRLVAVPFRYKVVPKMSDMEFDCVLANERDGIATKALHIYLRRYGEPCFLGDYRINEVFARGNGEAAITMRVVQYVMDNFKVSDGGQVFISEAYDDFLSKNGITPDMFYINTFSQMFCRAASEQFRACRGKAVRTSGHDMQSCMRGFAFKT